MFETVPLEDKHLAKLLDEPMNASLRPHMTNLNLVKSGDCATILVNGEVMLCGGINEYWKGRGHLWSVFSENSREHFVPTFRGIQAWIRTMLQNKYDRIEMSITCGFLQGHRRAKLLGFKMELLRAEKYLFGEDCSIYSLVRK